ncbi:MAG TPA: MBL fold metallo-hydrolase [Niabella sp.]|nr:MBL fold metallo-hydrolase [Niabella sp.]HOZ96178.1 MBL fold metallo-hydrolase [Niabella sp.]HQW13543.1 MBL fold metallo-hydrolase [Niabella sp.]HQX18937.1 MBL fold metallo-hydrolase [Niabella sp.]HQX40442.1 MBL fold metallo-hydrolase [Niabella sp.]
MISIQRFTFNPIQENTYVLFNDKGHCAIIDPGCYFEEERNQLFQFIQANKLTPVYLLNTHCHLDHVFGNKYVSETWQLPLYLHEAEKVVLSFAPKSAEMYGLPFENYSGEMKWLTPGEKIFLDEDELEILFTPGHSLGSVSFYCKNDGFVISGDALFAGSIGRTDLPGGDYDQLENAIKTQLYTLPDPVKVYSGHGSGTSIGFEKKNNPFVRADD